MDYVFLVIMLPISVLAVLSAWFEFRRTRNSIDFGVLLTTLFFIVTMGFFSTGDDFPIYLDLSFFSSLMIFYIVNATTFALVLLGWKRYYLLPSVFGFFLLVFISQTGADIIHSPHTSSSLVLAVALFLLNAYKNKHGLSVALGILFLLPVTLIWIRFMAFPVLISGLIVLILAEKGWLDENLFAAGRQKKKQIQNIWISRVVS
jgi:hypothetical protein